MSRPVHIVTDTSSDLPPHFAKEWSITVVPLIVRFGQEIFRDGEISMDEFWARAEHPAFPETSQPLPSAYEGVFGSLVNKGHDVLCLSLASKHSVTYSTAFAAARQFRERVQVMDSLALSWGLGFQVLHAAQAARQGVTLDEIRSLVTTFRSRISMVLVLDTVEYVCRGGRASRLMPALDRMMRA